MKQQIISTIFILIVFNSLAQENMKNDSPQLNQIIIDTNSNQEILIGKCNKEGLIAFPEFNSNFESEYNNYKENLELINPYKDDFSRYQITIIMGTWCGDSKREVPRFYKIIDKLGIPEENITLICVDRKKKAGEVNIENYKIDLVPTFIFSINKIEKGRIIEAPIKNFESDIIEIIK